MKANVEKKTENLKMNLWVVKRRKLTGKMGKTDCNHSGKYTAHILYLFACPIKMFVERFLLDRTCSMYGM